ncbi:NAD(P)-dependent oxidoreductase [Chitinibacter sp. ZOR0017]|uniref:NAD(P)-dependent oxidoreductase n=1 Tax=Chitinibacter sp. ZOR0017 TaxID=1339254 RepID=UPI00064670ED|nr:NAD(P)-dependent oxidoreductase [Chitinibacter sp. ZOR0017]
MKIALIGATGFVGSAVLQELAQRGHTVTALVSNVAKVPALPGVNARASNAYDAADIAAAVAGHDAVISAFNPGWGKDDIQALFVQGHNAIVAGIKAAGVQSFLEVGGAGSLYIAPGLQLIDTPEFPAEWKEGALGARTALNLLREESALNWRFVSPPVFLAPGERSGQYRLGGDDVLFAGEQPAGISVADLAVAIVDEIESPKHSRQRFTVASV